MNFENRTIFANENCSEFFLGKLSDINQTITNFPQDVESDNFDQRGMDLIEEMKKTVKIGEQCFKRERRFKSGDSEEWKWSSYLSSFHICLPLLGKPSKKINTIFYDIKSKGSSFKT